MPHSNTLYDLLCGKSVVHRFVLLTPLSRDCLHPALRRLARIALSTVFFMHVTDGPLLLPFPLLHKIHANLYIVALLYSLATPARSATHSEPMYRLGSSSSRPAPPWCRRDGLDISDIEWNCAFCMRPRKYKKLLHKLTRKYFVSRQISPHRRRSAARSMSACSRPLLCWSARQRKVLCLIM